MKSLDGLELAGFIKQRHAHAVRSLRQGSGVQPRLAIVTSNTNEATATYLRVKQRYGQDIGASVDVYTPALSDALSLLGELNDDASCQGVILQLPFADGTQTETLLAAIDPRKDVDGLGPDSHFDAATPIAINWLLAGYNIELAGKRIVVVGQGRLVGKPLADMWEASGLMVERLDLDTPDNASRIAKADIVVTAAGVPGLIRSEMLKEGAVVVDAGVATDAGRLVGDVAEDVRERSDVTMTPVRGGVGPLTVCALFENLLTACATAR